MTSSIIVTEPLFTGNKIRENTFESFLQGLPPPSQTLMLIQHWDTPERAALSLRLRPGGWHRDPQIAGSHSFTSIPEPVPPPAPRKAVPGAWDVLNFAYARY